MWDDPKGALPHGEYALELARASNDRELEARSLSSLGLIHIVAEDFEEAIHCLEASLALYALLGNEQSASREFSLAPFAIGAPTTQHLAYRASEALCWAVLAIAQVYGGQVSDSKRSGRRALALSQAIKNVWVQINSTNSLTYGLLDAGAYEEALERMQHVFALAQSLPLVVTFQRFLNALGRTYHALQQREEARSTLEEAEAIAESVDLRSLHVPVLSQLCMHYAVVGLWDQAYRSALKAITFRTSFDMALFGVDFYSHYETEALVDGGEESQARAAVQRLGERLGSNRRYRISYLRSLGY